MLTTFWLRILYTYSPWVAASFGEFSGEAKGLVRRVGRNAGMNVRRSGALLRFEK